MNLAAVLRYFDEMIDMAFNGRHVGWICILVRGYFDESGTHDGSRVTSLAGYIGAAENWRLLLPEWQNILATDGDGMDVFHAADFEHYAREHKWNDRKRDTFLGKLADVANKYTWHGFGGSVIVADYNRLPEWVRLRIQSRYHFCFHVMMHLLRVQLDSMSFRDDLALAFEQKDKVIGRLLDDFDDILAQDYRGQFGPIIVGNKQKLPLLQVADFLVYEINTGLDNVLHSKKPTRPVLQRLMQHSQAVRIGNRSIRIEHMHHGYYDWSALQSLPHLLESDREQLAAGRSSTDIWWPASWHKNYKPKKKRKYISGYLKT